MVRGPDHQAAFVNPYTFVPPPRLPDDAPGFRLRPAGHDRLGQDRYSGRIEVELTARAPLLLRGVHPEERAPEEEEEREGEGKKKARFPRRSFPESDGEPVPFLPGSSLAGAIRSLHEVLAGGCVRVTNLDFCPTYRDVVQARGEEWTLAVVESEKDGRPESLRLCERVVWVPATLLADVLGSPENVVTGARVNVVGHERVAFFNRDQAKERAQVQRGDGWVVLVTDVGAREETRNRGKDGKERRATYWCAVGRLPTENTPGLSVTESAWSDYLAAVADSDDVRRARADEREGRAGAAHAGAAHRVLYPAQPVPAQVTYYDEPIGFRHEARPVLRAGQVVWAQAGRVASDESKRPERATRRQVTGIALSAVWRHPGAHPVRERIPPVLLPCDGRDTTAGADGKASKELRLCPSCRVFGSADTRGEDSAEARQRSYRGHVRFGEARPLGEVATSEVRVAPLGSPKPGAGQMYLLNGTSVEGGVDDEVEQKTGGKGGKKAGKKGETAESTSGPNGPRRPLREWGSAADPPDRPRPLRGRKGYWLTRRSAERPFFRAHEGEWEGELASVAEQVEAGARFTFPVYVDGLDASQLGGLLSALDPSLLFDTDGADVGYAVGGGKPLGFGACTARITVFEVTGAHARYLGADDQRELTVTDAVDAFREATLIKVKETWKAARAVLTLDHVEPHAVWYPPEKPLPASGPLHVDDLAPGFKGYWTHSQGLGVGESGRPLRSLPRVTYSDQTLPVLDDKGNPAT